MQSTYKSMLLRHWSNFAIVLGFEQGHKNHTSFTKSPKQTTMKIPCPTPNPMKIKTLIQSHIFPPFYHVVRAITKAKSLLIVLINNYKREKRWKKKRKSLYSSFRLHYNWSSSHVLPIPEEPTGVAPYYDSTWNSSVFPEKETGGGGGGGDDEEVDPALARYLRWLEEKVPENSASDVVTDEIDRLADLFIASCHEKFRLEKQESYRRYQEMMARSM